MNRNLPPPTLSGLPCGFRRDGAISIELDGGVAVFRAARVAQDRVEALLEKQIGSGLTPDEEQEMRQYEELDDYLS